MPLTDFQKHIARLLAANRTSDSYLAGGGALHFLPSSERYSNDLDYFHDSAERVSSAFDADRGALEGAGCLVTVSMSHPGFIRAQVSKSEFGQTKIEWSHDSAWRFMPVEYHEDIGFYLHRIDLAVNKLLALSGRNEVRDYVDVLILDRDTLSLGALCWAAVGKDPGYTPHSLLEILKRRGRFQQEDISRLMFTEPLDVKDAKLQWLSAVESAEVFIRSRPLEEAGCLYYDSESKGFVAPDIIPHSEGRVICHFGRPGGVLPAF